jgi:hypothetical protein
VIKIKRSIRYGAKIHVVGKSGKKWRVEKMRWELVANFLPPFVNIFADFLPQILLFCADLCHNEQIFAL